MPSQAYLLHVVGAPQKTVVSVAIVVSAVGAGGGGLRDGGQGRRVRENT